MKGKKSQLFIGLVFVFLGIGLSYQWKTSTKYFNNRSNSIYTKLTYEIETLTKQKEESIAVLQKYKNDVNTYENNAANANRNIKELKDKIDKIKLISGLVNVHGSGIIIRVEPTLDIYGWEEPFSSDLIISMVNDLNSAGAEAISINDHRYHTNTKIKDVTNSILINGSKFSNTQAFIFKAIGNPDELSRTIKLKDNIVEILEDLNFQVRITEESDIKILK